MTTGPCSLRPDMRSEPRISFGAVISPKRQAASAKATLPENLLSKPEGVCTAPAGGSRSPAKQAALIA